MSWRYCFPTGALLALILAVCPCIARADSIEDKVVVCAACHGLPVYNSVPVIWGQNEGYIYIELRDMKSGARKNEQMAAIVATMERDEMLALAAYISAKPWPNLQQPRASTADADHFAVMANSAQCPACHQAGYVGAGTQPRVAGQSYQYLLKTLQDFKSGARGNSDWMTSLLRTYAAADLEQMARVLAGM